MKESDRIIEMRSGDRQAAASLAGINHFTGHLTVKHHYVVFSTTARLFNLIFVWIKSGGRIFHRECIDLWATGGMI